MLNVFSKALIWHFIEAPKEILKGVWNFVLFIFNYFSINQLLKTFFSHWHRYSYSYGKRWDIKRYFEAFTFNIISRVMGAILRSVFIIIGVVSEIAVFTMGVLILCLWLVLPIISLWFFFFGLNLIF